MNEEYKEDYREDYKYEMPQSIEVLNEAIYRELSEFGIFFTCNISMEDIADNSFRCALLRLDDGTFAGTVIFRIYGNSARLLTVDIVPPLRGEGVGSMLFHRAASLLGEEGILDIMASDPVTEIGRDYLRYDLGFDVTEAYTCLRYGISMLRKSLLYSKRDDYLKYLKNVKSGNIVDDGLKERYLSFLGEKNIAASKALLYSPDSLFYMNDGAISSFLGVEKDQNGTSTVVDTDTVSAFPKQADMRALILAKLVEQTFDDDKQYSFSQRPGIIVLNYIAESQKTADGVKKLLGAPAFDETITTYCFKLKK